MADESLQFVPGPRRDIPRPPRVWTDAVAHWLRKNPVPVATGRVIAGVGPFLFALFVAAPLGLVVLPLFIPKFVRNAIRRRRYGVRLSEQEVARIPGTRSE